MNYAKKILQTIVFLSLCTVSLTANAGFELVCKGRQAQSKQKIVQVDCANRKDFIDKLGAAWRTLRQNSIGGHLENMCWESYSQAKDIHPSISFNEISDGFLMRCNMGLEYVN
jgi:hypothetical protein